MPRSTDKKASVSIAVSNTFACSGGTPVERMCTAFMCAHTHTCTHTHARTHTHTSKYAHAYAHVYTQVHIHAPIHTYTHTKRETHTYKHTSKYVYTHTHTQKLVYLGGPAFGNGCDSVHSPSPSYPAVTALQSLRHRSRDPPSHFPAIPGLRSSVSFLLVRAVMAVQSLRHRPRDPPSHFPAIPGACFSVLFLLMIYQIPFSRKYADHW